MILVFLPYPNLLPGWCGFSAACLDLCELILIDILVTGRCVIGFGILTTLVAAVGLAGLQNDGCLFLYFGLQAVGLVATIAVVVAFFVAVSHIVLCCQ